MKKAHELPLAVNNLRAIWDKKKVEMKFTQVEAAKKLGWTQGAISHYLNNLTELGPAAVIKFANFLGVDPLDIDPAIQEFLPNTRTRTTKFTTDNVTKITNQKHYDKNPESAFWCETRIEDITWVQHGPALNDVSMKGATWFAHVCPVKDYPIAKIFLIQLKGEKKAQLYTSSDLPKTSTIKKKLACLEIEVNFSRIDA